jgi:hypothetical protein
MWRVIGRAVTLVSRDRRASLFRVNQPKKNACLTLKMKVPRQSQTSKSARSKTRCHVPERKPNFQQYKLFWRVWIGYEFCFRTWSEVRQVLKTRLESLYEIKNSRFFLTETRHFATNRQSVTFYMTLSAKPLWQSQVWKKGASWICLTNFNIFFIRMRKTIRELKEQRKIGTNLKSSKEQPWALGLLSLTLHHTSSNAIRKSGWWLVRLATTGGGGGCYENKNINHVWDLEF